MEKINKKSAPQRDVGEIIRQGRWGSVVYLHRLSCGHIEERKRPAATPKIACGLCVRSDAFAKQQLSLVRSGVGYEQYTDIEMPPDPTEVEMSSILEDVARMRAAIAKNLDISADDVLIHVDEDEDGISIGGGYIFLDPDALKRFSV